MNIERILELGRDFDLDIEVHITQSSREVLYTLSVTVGCLSRKSGPNSTALSAFNECLEGLETDYFQLCRGGSDYFEIGDTLQSLQDATVRFL